MTFDETLETWCGGRCLPWPVCVLCAVSCVQCGCVWVWLQLYNSTTLKRRPTHRNIELFVFLFEFIPHICKRTAYLSTLTQSVAVELPCTAMQPPGPGPWTGRINRAQYTVRPGGTCDYGLRTTDCRLTFDVF